MAGIGLVDLYQVHDAEPVASTAITVVHSSRVASRNGTGEVMPAMSASAPTGGRWPAATSRRSPRAGDNQQYDIPGASTPHPVRGQYITVTFLARGLDPNVLCPIIFRTIYE